LSSERVIEVTGLTKKYKEVTAVSNLDLNVYRGDVFGFLGPNGAGKSTTIRMLLSLIKPTKGTIKIFDKELTKQRRKILSKVGSIVEKPDFYLYLSAYKNLEILGKMSGTDTSKKRLMEVLETVGLEKRAGSKVKTFSHGMKQRLGLAQALLHDPELIILDEPTTGLDPQGMKEIRDLIIRLSKEQHKTILLSSHILREVELIANRMIIINKGTTRVEGTVEELMKSDNLKVTVKVSEPDNVKSMISESRWNQYLEGTANNELEFAVNKELVPELNKFLVEKGVNVEAVIPKRSLEEYFLEITKENVE
jgi:ABC-2 type transport system ATP-binding protein